MTVQTSYPGVYIQELPSLTHSVTSAPTSVAVFVGYTQPFLTPATSPPAPVQLFSFADYQANFGGFFSSPWQPDYVGQAVFQFFQNGGMTCYVVGLTAASYFLGGAAQGPVVAATTDATALPGITFTAVQPVGIPATAPGGPLGVPMLVTLSNVTSSDPTATPPVEDTADIVISYGTTVETYRKVAITNLQTGPGSTSPLQNSSLVTVVVAQGTTSFPSSGTTFPNFALGYENPPQQGWTVIDPGAFAEVFTTDNPLDKVPVFNLLATPGITDLSVTSDAIAYCERKRAFYIMDTPSSASSGWDVGSLVASFSSTTATLFPVSTNAAVYYPWLATTDPVTGLPSTAPPSGFVAGIYGQEDNARGVWKSPAGTETALLGVAGVEAHGVMTDSQQGVLNENAVDCLRQFPGIGTVVFGARTTAAANPAYQQWKYVAVRRTALFIEQSLYASLTWAVFEGNDTPLWNALTQEVSAFMLSLFRQGAFAGSTPSDAFVVKCDSTTTTPTDVANGTVNILVGFAPLVPAEFVVVQIAQLAGQAQS
jgi:uncharacterized protein